MKSCPANENNRSGGGDNCPRWGGVLRMEQWRSIPNMRWILKDIIYIYKDK
jgi:hypothetical protein